MMSLKISNLNINLEGNTILEDIDWDISLGSYNLLLGGNGSGKSTLVKAILGLITPTKGTITYKGNPITSKIISQHFGYIPQFSTIKKDFPITVEEVIRLECNSSPKICDLEPTSHLKPLGLDKLFDKNVGDLSGGEMQKVLIARGLVTEPDILILDEPTNNLDSQSEKFILKFLAEYFAQGKKTIIHITHDKHEVPDIKGIREVMIRDGKLIN